MFPLCTMRQAEYVSCMAWSPDGNLLASDEDKTVRLWTCVGGENDTLIGHTDYVRCVAWNKDGSFLASGGDDNTVKIWDMTSNHRVAKCTLKGHTDTVWSVAWSPDGDTLASASTDNTVRLWTSNGEEKNIIELRDIDCDIGPFSKFKLYEALWSPEGNAFAFRYGNTVAMKYGNIDSIDLDLRASLNVDTIAFSHDGKLFASGKRTSICVWDMSTGRPVEKCSTMRGHTEQVNSMAWSVDNVLASGGDDKTVRIWTSDRKPYRGHGKQSECICYDSDGDFDFDKNCPVVDPCLVETLVGHTEDNPACICKHHTGEDGDEYEMNHECLVDGHFEGVTIVAWSPDGKTLASGSYDKTIKLWTSRTGKRNIEQMNAL